MQTKTSIAYPENSTSALRGELAEALTRLAEIYGKAGEMAMARGDRHAVFIAVQKERAAHELARKAALGLVGF